MYIYLYLTSIYLSIGLYVCMYVYMYLSIYLSHSVCLYMYTYLSIFLFSLPQNGCENKGFKKNVSPPKMLGNIKSIFIFSPLKSREKSFFYFLSKKTGVKIKSSLFSLPKQQSWK